MSHHVTPCFGLWRLAFTLPQRSKQNGHVQKQYCSTTLCDLYTRIRSILIVRFILSCFCICILPLLLLLILSFLFLFIFLLFLLLILFPHLPKPSRRTMHIKDFVTLVLFLVSNILLPHLVLLLHFLNILLPLLPYLLLLLFRFLFLHLLHHLPLLILLHTFSTLSPSTFQFSSSSLSPPDFPPPPAACKGLLWKKLTRQVTNANLSLSAIVKYVIKNTWVS